ncbi:23S rRNA (guanosine(2251)-2'-O)-methyltransferase RlmB [Acanthopleuribacter pedis]|uniref:23S rRNA (Guanosine(2251)-2'-O)-methyltransferase RlmB n=1 Tax=Acanthopleuribacter pedis TaxID=442870 RepID=A0A8J7Q8A0_9BACT|nr:23S rRNA (guanosine(2251)-2'-O)-methyltransferase RlmB [Acanthopleuribacter pedis]MBO1322462.1 23S rRNA (guanosine(2251)-2'-O)-methyltransferase RlmB [Acanthopleuribacter pedis]
MKSSRSGKWQKGKQGGGRSNAPQPKRSVGQGDAYITGWNGVRECLASDKVKVHQVWLDPRKMNETDWKGIRQYGRQIEETGAKETPYGPLTQGIAALVKLPEAPDLDELLDDLVERGETPLLVVLDQVEDPMNLGQILRTCEGAGVHGLVVAKHRAIHLNQTVAQVSQGAFAWVPLIEAGNLRQTIDHLKQRGVWTVGTAVDPRAKPWHAVDMRDPLALVMGAEGKGLRRLTQESCDHLVYLPMAGRLDSLNVGAATAAVVFEAVRQRAAAEPSEG